MGFMDRRFYSLDCHNTLPSAQQVRHKTDAPNWPDRRDFQLVKKE
jgi:hypothetical protein